MEPEQARLFMYDLLRALRSKRGSELLISAALPPSIKIDGQTTPLSQTPLRSDHTQLLARAIMTEGQAAEFEKAQKCTFDIAPAGIGRFGVNCFMQEGSVAIVVRPIPVATPASESLSLAARLRRWLSTK